MLHNIKLAAPLNEPIEDADAKEEPIIPKFITELQAYDAVTWIKKVNADQIKELDLSTEKTRDVKKDFIFWKTPRQTFYLGFDATNEEELAVFNLVVDIIGGNTYYSSKISIFDSKDQRWRDAIDFVDYDSAIIKPQVIFKRLKKLKSAVYSDLLLKIYEDRHPDSGQSYEKLSDYLYLAISVANPIECMISLPDGTLLYVSANGKIYALNIEEAKLKCKSTHKYASEKDHGTEKDCCNLWSNDADGIKHIKLLTPTRLATLSNLIHIWDIPTAKILYTIDVPPDNIVEGYLALALIDNHWLACSVRGEIRLCNLKTNEWSDLFSGHSAPITSIVDLKNGSFASGSMDGTIRIWNLISQTCEIIIPVDKNYKGLNSFVSTDETGSLISQHYNPLQLVTKQSNFKTFLELRSLEMRPLEISDISDLLNALHANKSVETLNLSNMTINDGDVTSSLIFKDKPLVTLLKKNYSIKVLDIRNTKVTAAGVAQIRNILKKLPDRPQLTIRHESLKEHVATEIKETKVHNFVSFSEPPILDNNFLLSLQCSSHELFNVISKERKNIQAEHQRQIVIKNYKLREYYYAFTCQFLDTWLACKSIHSGWVKNSQMNMTDHILAAFDKGVKYFSVPGLALISDIFSSGAVFLNEREKAEAVNHMATYFKSMRDADIFIEEIGCHLSLALQNRILALNLDNSSFQLVKNGIKKVVNYIRANDINNEIKECAAKDCDKIITAIIKNKISAHPELTDIENILLQTIGDGYKTSSTVPKSHHLPISTSSSSRIYQKLESSRIGNNNNSIYINEDQLIESNKTAAIKEVKDDSIDLKTPVKNLQKQVKSPEEKIQLPTQNNKRRKTL